MKMSKFWIKDWTSLLYQHLANSNTRIYLDTELLELQPEDPHEKHFRVTGDWGLPLQIS